MNFSKGESSISCKNRNSAKSLHFSNDDEDVIVLSDDEVNHSNDKCMICYCILTDSQRARVKALMIDCSDSTNIFNNYCNLLNILLLESMKWNFQTEPMPFCSACLAMVKTLAQLSEKMMSIKNQIKGILDIIKSEIVKSMKNERSSKVTAGKGKRSSFSGKPTPLDKVDYCRSEALKGMTPEVVPLVKTEACNSSAEESEVEIDNSSTAEPGHVSVSCISQAHADEEEYRRKQNQEIPGRELYLSNETYKQQVLGNSSRNKRQHPQAETHFQSDIREQIRQVSSTQRGNSPDQYQPSKQIFADPRTDNMGSNTHETFLDPGQMSQSVHPEFSQYYPMHKYNHHKSMEHATTSILTEPESDESQSRMLQMEETAAFEPWKYKGNLSSAASFCFKRFRPEELRDEYVQPPPVAPPDLHSERDSSSGQYMNETMEDDSSSFINVNIQIIENSDTKEAYCCRICQRRFTTRNSAISHMQAVHLKVKKLQCKFCTKTFFKKFNCLVHINKIHLKGRHAKINPESAVVYLVD